MATSDQSRRMQNRGLLTADDRRFWSGEKDVEDEDERAKQAREKRYNVRRRIENLREDLEILRAAGEDDLINEFFGAVREFETRDDRVDELEREIEELKDRLNSEE